MLAWQTRRKRTVNIQINAIQDKHETFNSNLRSEINTRVILEDAKPTGIRLDNFRIVKTDHVKSSPLLVLQRWREGHVERHTPGFL